MSHLLIAGLRKLYSRFICGPHFRPWFNKQVTHCKEKFQIMQRERILDLPEEAVARLDGPRCMHACGIVRALLKESGDLEEKLRARLRLFERLAARNSDSSSGDGDRPLAS